MKNYRSKALPALLLAVLFLFPACEQPAPPAETEVPMNEAAPETPVPPEIAEIPDGPRIVVEGRSAIHALTEEEKAAYPQATNLPTLYIDLGRRNLNDVHHSVYTDGTYSIVYGGEGVIGQPIQMKGRGNYSWSFPQKTYGLKLGTAEPLLGMNSGRKWVLITTYSDKTLLRNFMTLNLASEIVGLDYSVQTRYVDVYVNGKYNGLYVLSQKITLGEGQVDADALFECEIASRHGGQCSNCIVCPSGCHAMFREPIGDAATQEEHDALLSTYRQLIVKADVAITTGKGIGVYSRYIDVDSFVDWYIVNELVKNYDSGFTTSCYCYVKDGKLHMGPCWDYDTCMGNQNVATCLYPEGYHVGPSPNSPWYNALTADEGFKKALHDRWTELWDGGRIADFMQMLDDEIEIISESQKQDAKKWPQKLKMRDLRGDRSTYTYEEEVNYLKNWLNIRINWLNGEWHN